MSAFTQVSEYAVHKVTRNSPIKSCLLDPWPTFLKKYSNITLLSITKFVNYSFIEGNVNDGFKTAVVTSRIKKASLPAYDLKSYHPVSGLYKNWLNVWLQSNISIP